MKNPKLKTIRDVQFDVEKRIVKVYAIDEKDEKIMLVFNESTLISLLNPTVENTILTFQKGIKQNEN